VNRISIEEVKANFEDALLLASNGKQRLVITEDGEDRAALIPLEDLALLENLDGDAPIEKETVPRAEVQAHLSEDLAQVAGREERIVVIDDKEELAVLVPSRDLATLEGLDTRLDIEAAKRLLEGMRGSPES